MSPKAGAHVLFPGGTLTAKYVPEVRQKSTGPPLQNHIKLKNNWSDKTMNVIKKETDWKPRPMKIQLKDYTKL